ncbi:MAG: hypothetical protein KJ666_00615 [Bacteroidetes bacterium]|nr:hypothetical protein [Bacteroidota bacterium]MBU2584845.1 hypothetical protein [Bacteroidota bacterium]
MKNKNHTNQKLIILGFVFIFTVASIINSCKLGTEPDTDTDGTDPQNVIITGTVLDKTTGSAIESAVVRIKHDSIETGVTSDNLGKFTKTISIIGSKELTVIASKEGFSSDTVKAFAIAGRETKVPTLKLARQTLTTPSGSAASVILYSQSVTKIGVKESGDVEIARITFQVQDSTGQPIDLSNSVTVNFTIGARPAGGEYIFPLFAKTDDNGRAPVNLVSGTKAGAVQLIAEVSIGTKIIRSKPVSITIHGGLPDAAHFSIYPQSKNFPAYEIYGLTNPITAIVGDKYKNPVKPETAVYFTTTGGIIEGSILTNSLGRGTVTLTSAKPWPEHPTLGKGFATITASTADETYATIKAESIVLFSGAPTRMSISPTTFDIPNGGSQFFTYVVADQNGNPLAPGQNITVSVEGEYVNARGEVNINMPDTHSKAWTQFSFFVADTNDSLNVAKPVFIRVQTDGPNGTNAISITGVAR